MNQGTKTGRQRKGFRGCMVLSYVIALALWLAAPTYAFETTDPALSGVWYLDAMHGRSPAGPSWGVVTIKFGNETPGSLPGSTPPTSYGASGNGPCNLYGVSYSMPSGPGTWHSLDGLVTTRMWCGDAVMHTEYSYFHAFSEIASYQIIEQTGHQRLIMYNETEHSVLEFVSEVEFAETEIVDWDFPVNNFLYLPIVNTN